MLKKEISTYALLNTSKTTPSNILMWIYLLRRYLRFKSKTKRFAYAQDHHLEL